MFVSEEEHESDWVVEFVHLLEVGDLIKVADVDDGKILDAIGDLVEDFILTHAVGVPVTAKADDNKALVFGENRLIDMPACDEMGNDDGAHGEGGGVLNGEKEMEMMRFLSTQ